MTPTLTPEQISTLTLQEACDYAVAKIVEQGEPCLNSKKECTYDNGKGQHCAVGWLLPHDDKNIMDHAGMVHSICDKFPNSVPEVVKSNQNALYSLQVFHDKGSRYFRSVALRNLKVYINTDAPQYQQWLDMGEK